VNKTVTITTNDPVQPKLNVPLSAFVEHGMAAEGGESLEAVLFGDRCAECHATPADGLTGAAAYDAVCQMCHGPISEYATSLPAEVLEPAALRSWIAEGRAEVGMPGYESAMGGPLSDEQIDTLVEALIIASE
jgi:mono/diheme cytochrome c family protein